MFWGPQPGPQVRAATCPADFPFFGGSRGGGKSDCTLGRHIRGAELYEHRWNGLIVRRKYKEFAELRRRIDELIINGLPAERVGGEEQINHWRFDNGAAVTLAAIQRMSMVGDWVGHQFTEISIEECTTFPFFSRMIDELQGSLRSPHGVPTHFFGTGNPGGPGHYDVKEFFRLGADGHPPNRPFLVEIGELKGKKYFQSRVFIPSFLYNNRILVESDPRYVLKLIGIRDPMLRAAWLEGNWDVFIGQAFNLTQRHIIKPIPVPDYVSIYMTYDWGWGKPYSVGYWWIDNDGRLYRFGELYGWNKVPNEGVRQEDSKQAEAIIEYEHKLGISEREITRLCDPTCFNKKPNYMGGGQGPSTASVFADFGITLKPGDPERKLKIRQFRERLALPKDEKELPMMVIYDTCTQFKRTIPALAMDEDNPEDIDTDQEDHQYDEAALICMHRPLVVTDQQIQAIVAQKEQAKRRKQLTPSHQKVWGELDHIREKLKEMEEAEGDLDRRGSVT